MISVHSKSFLLPLILVFASIFVRAFPEPQANAPINVNPTQNTSSSTACADVHLIVVRASSEKPGQGVIGTLATMISGAIPGSTVEAIDYPAVLSPYDTSSYNGTQTTTKQLESYVDRCDRGKVVLLGYSQGAHVVGDVMCGGGEAVGIGPATPPISKKYQDKVIAMIQMGDPRHMPTKSFDVGSSQNPGIFPRPANISCDSLASKIRSYCDKGDPFCDLGDNITVHLSYTQRYNQDAYNFTIAKLKDAKAVNQGSDGSLSLPSSGNSKTSAGSTIHLGQGLQSLISLLILSTFTTAISYLL